MVKHDDVTDQEGGPHPASRANFLSLLYFHWMSGVFKTGNKRPLEKTDLFPLLQEDETREVTEKLQRLWTEETQNCRQNGKTPKLWRSVLRSIPKYEMGIIVFNGLLESVTRLMQPFLIGYFLSAMMSNRDRSLMYGCVGLLVVTSVVSSLCHNHASFRCDVLGMRLSSAIKGVIYHKILHLDQKSVHEFTTGHVIDLVSNDVQRIEQAPLKISLGLRSVVDVPAIICLILFFFGWQAIMGLVVIVAFLPCVGYVSSWGAKLRVRTAKVSDQRISIIEEVVRGIRTIKTNVWEHNYQNKIKDIRRREIKIIYKSNFLRLCFQVLRFISWPLATFASMLAIILTGQLLTSVHAFMLLAIYSILRLSLSTRVPAGIRKAFETYVSLKRMEEFLNLTNLVPLNEAHSKTLSAGQGQDKIERNVPMPKPTNQEKAVSEKSEKSPTKSSLKDCDSNKKERRSTGPDVKLSVSNLTYKVGAEDGRYLLQDVSFEALSNSLTIVAGLVGSGKSLLLSSIAGETVPTTGTVYSSGSIAYVPQTAWVFSGTIRENILFGDTLDEKRYVTVMDACALTKDIQRFPSRDETVVGENGVVLSGGQQSRVSLARAVYANANLYLLDDPLSSVDRKVGKHIFEKCIRELLCDKTRVLVSHEEDYLRSADQVIVLYKGSVLGKGRFAELKEQSVLSTVLDPVYSMAKKAKVCDPEEMEEEFQHLLKVEASKVSLSNGIHENSDLEIPEEDREIGNVSWKLYWNYLRAGMSIPAIITVMVFFLITQVIVISPDLWLSHLTGKGSREDQRDVTSLTVYTALVIASFIFVVICGLLFLWGSVRSAERLHDRMMIAVIQAPVLFFDTNPVGRIENRFSKDIGCLDELLPYNFLEALQNGLSMLTACLVPSIANTVHFFIVAPVLVIYYFIGKYFLKTSRDLRRLESICRSPVFSHISDTIIGLATIRTRGKAEDFTNMFYRHQDLHNRSFYMAVAAGRWLGVRVQLLSAIYTGLVGVALILLSTEAALAGLALIYTISKAGIAPASVRAFSSVEEKMTSTERVMTYTKIKPEPGYQVERLPPDNWPIKGDVSFKNVSLRYYTNGPLILKNASFEIKRNQRIGIAGRTGAGKSSLVAALLRMPECDGEITIDGVRINDISLHESRRCISYLSQRPVLFSGTLRSNLDPLGKKRDVELWRALEEVQMRNMVEGLNGQLDYELLERGSNLSIGERQLVCLARTLLDHSKIVILDEPTAHVDPQTEQIIWNTVYEKLKDSTVIIIAHRINTIRYCDNILVLQDGHVVEYGTFDELLDKTGGVLADMITDSALV